MIEKPDFKYFCRGACQEDILELVEVTQSAFGVARTGDFGTGLKNRLETFDDNRILIEQTSSGEKIIGSVPIFRYPLHLAPGITMQSGGLFMVAVRKEYQRRGFGQKVIADCNDYLRKQGCEINLLFTGSPDFYRHQGYEQGGGKPLFVLEKTDLDQFLNQNNINNEPTITTRNLIEKDLSEIARIYEIFNESFPLTRIRSLQYWQHNFKLNPNRFSENITVFLFNQQIVAYLWGNKSEQGFEIVEYAIDKKQMQFSEELINNIILKYLLTQIDKNQLNRLNFHLFQSFPLVKSAVNAGARDCTAYWSGLMVAILNLPAFLKKWLEFHQTYQIAKISQSELKKLQDIQFALKIEEENLVYRLIDGRIYVEWNPPSLPSRMVSISRKNFSILTMGNFTAEELVDSEYWTCDSDLIPYLNLIFPHLEGMVYPLDGF